MSKKSLERITVITPAYDKRDPDPNKNYGIGASKIVMVLKGDRGAVHFVFSTGMYLEKTMQELAAKGELTPSQMENGEYFILNTPNGYDVGYHAPTPQFEGQTISRENCEYIGAPCYCDGSSLLSDEWMEILLSEGSEKIWQMLEDEYKDRFDYKTPTP